MSLLSIVNYPLWAKNIAYVDLLIILFFNLKNPKQKKTMNFYPAAPEGEEEKPSTPAKVQVKPVAPVKPPPKEPPSFEFSVDLPSISAQDL